MKHRAAAFLTGAALMLSPVAAAAQPEPNAIERFNNWLDETWDEAGDSGLKFEPKPVDMAQFRVVTPTPWTARDPGDIERYRNEAPPAAESVLYGNEPLQNWLDWYDLEIEAAREAKDTAREQAAWLEKVFITYSRVRRFTDYGPSSYTYQDAVRSYIGSLAPEPDTSGFSLRRLMTMSQEEADRLRKEAFDATSPETLVAYENALRHYLSIIANEEVDGAPLEGDALQDSGANQVKMLADLLEAQGRSAEAAPIRAASDAFDFNNGISGYNWLVNWRYQNLKVGNFPVAAEWSYKMIERLATMVPVDDPRVLRVILLSAADHFAANDVEKAQGILEAAVRICGQTASCTTLSAEPGTAEGIEMLQAMGENSQAEAFRLAIAGNTAEDNSALTALALIKQLEEERDQCYDQVEANPENPLILTPAAKAIVAECDAVIGPDIFDAYAAAGNDFSRSDAMQMLAEGIADGALQTGRVELAERYFGMLVDNARTADSPLADDLALRHAMSLIALRRFDEADQVLQRTRASTEADMRDGLLYSNVYSNRIRGVESLMVDRFLLDTPNAAKAFELARSRADEFREFRQSQVGSVFDETNLARIIGFNETFREAADASWALPEESPARRDEAQQVAFDAVQDALADKTSLSLAYAMADKAEFGGDPQVSALVERRRELLDLLAPHRGVDAGSWGETSFPADAREKIARQREFEAIAELSNEYAAINRTLQSAAPDYFKLIRPAPLSLDDAQAILQPDEAVLLLLPSDYGTHAMVLTSKGLRWHRSDLTFGEINQLVRRLLWFSGGQIEPTNEELAEWTDGVDGGAKGFDRDTAHRLYSELIAPLSDAFDGKRHLFYAGGGSLGSLPLGILVTDTPTGRDDDPQALRDTNWLAGEANIVRIPSLQALAFQRRYGSEGAANADEFRGFGDPVLAGKSQTRSRGTRGAPPSSLATLLTSSDAGPVANVETLRSLARLPGTEQELTQMAQAFGTARSAVRLGEQATETAFKQADLDNVGVIALATHGLTAGEVGAAEPGLVFTPPASGTPQDDGYLTASEVAAMRINADWVILSACNTAAGDGDSGAGLSGLARAFFYAGASNLLASHWPVRDDVAARLTVRTIELARDNPQMSRAEAFAAAMREIREDSSADGKMVGGYDTTFAHPSAWAPFELIGDAGAR